MSTAKISFEVEGVKHSLYFGVLASRLFREKLDEIVKRKKEAGINPAPESEQSFAAIMYGALCNQADIDEVLRPTFAKAYELMEAIAGDDELTMRIYKAWEEAKPNEALINLVNGNKKKVEESQS